MSSHIYDQKSIKHSVESSRFKARRSDLCLAPPSLLVQVLDTTDEKKQRCIRYKEEGRGKKEEGRVEKEKDELLQQITRLAEDKAKPSQVKDFCRIQMNALWANPSLV